MRLVVLVPIGSISLLEAPPERAASVAVAVAVLAMWTCGYAWWLSRAGGMVLPLALDVVVMLGASTGPWTGVVGDDNRAPLRLLVTFAAVTYQWYTPPVVGSLAALVTIGGLLGSSVAGGADVSTMSGQGWVLVAAALSRAAWTLVLRAATRADELAAEAERARRAAQVEAAVRADQRELANALHDTAATTMLMVGTGRVPAGAGWLAPQARRDLERMRSDGREPPDRADLVALLREDLEAAHLTVEFEGPEQLPLPFDVARAIADATREALNNVRRHAGVERAVVRLGGAAGGLWLEIADEGTGFATGDVRATSRGLTHSVLGRMRRIGGAAVITSAVGTGTVVRLEWPGGAG
ncbi:sensor histidine kinase [Pseudonocardia sp. TRM90224]|uniref:sensor histidine kinase n=1 Tax=Pseudonocardia sp. TRM90224 TaxID=2812678 RepID=UPI001E35553A|nr:hypothetical protein [Pseudonocardia sp. TRM90224]